MKHIIAITLLALAALVAAGCENKPHPITPVGDLKCGYTSHWCPEGGCCLNEEVCRPAVSEYPQGYCAFVGGPGSTFGSRPSKRPQDRPR